ncbi:hypothetical protein BH23GEM1_BH23GEM1_11210 [soil metagenome]
MKEGGGAIFRPGGTGTAGGGLARSASRDIAGEAQRAGVVRGQGGAPDARYMAVNRGAAASSCARVCAALVAHAGEDPAPDAHARVALERRARTGGVAQLGVCECGGPPADAGAVEARHELREHVLRATGREQDAHARFIEVAVLEAERGGAVGEPFRIPQPSGAQLQLDHVGPRIDVERIALDPQLDERRNRLRTSPCSPVLMSAARRRAGL